MYATTTSTSSETELQCPTYRYPLETLVALKDCPPLEELSWHISSVFMMGGRVRFTSGVMPILHGSVRRHPALTLK